MCMFLLMFMVFLCCAISFSLLFMTSIATIHCCCLFVHRTRLSGFHMKGITFTLSTTENIVWLYRLDVVFFIQQSFIFQCCVIRGWWTCKFLQFPVIVFTPANHFIDVISMLHFSKIKNDFSCYIRKEIHELEKTGETCIACDWTMQLIIHICGRISIKQKWPNWCAQWIRIGWCHIVPTTSRHFCLIR